MVLHAGIYFSLARARENLHDMALFKFYRYTAIVSMAPEDDIMATQPYDDILKKAREELSEVEQLRLAEELKVTTTTRDDGSTRKTLYDALNERGIIGSIADVPSDLSTNPKHMEGFGENAQ